MIAFLKLIRYKNLLMVLLTMVLTKYALINSLIFNHPERDFQFIILVFSVLLITASGYIINDIYDIKADQVNKPNKVCIDINISKKNAWKIYFLLIFLGLFSGVYLSFFQSSKEKSLYFILIILLLFIYSKYLKKSLLLGNIIISFCISLSIYITFLFSSEKIIYSNISQKIILLTTKNPNILIPVYFYCFFAFITTLIREIIKDIEDINGDLKIKAKTLPILFGRKRASKVAFFCSSILLVFLLIVLQFAIHKTLFLLYGIILILLPLLYFMYLLWNAEKKKDFSKLSNLMKVIMLFGILSMLLFTIN